MKNMIIVAAVVGLVAPVVAAWAAEAASAPAGELNLSACLADPPEFAKQLEAELAELDKAVDGAGTPLDQATAHLATTNWLIAVPTARPAIRWLVGLDQPTDLQTISARADQARHHIEKARAALKSAGDLKDAARRKAADLRLAADSLEPFVNLFGAAAPGADTAKRRSAFSEAALSLAIGRESDKPDLSACALLWQSFAWECAGRRERATVSLPSALVRPTQPDFDFFSRLLKCRLAAEDGLHTSAFALATRVRGSCDLWFSKEPPEQVAARRRLAAVVQYRIGRAWLEQLRKANSQAAATDLDAMLTSLRDVLYDKGRPGPAYVPENIVPILVKPPSVSAGAPPTTSASSPASSKVSDE
jgi:hypothetical protein